MKFRIDSLCPSQRGELAPELQKRIEGILPLTVQIVKRPPHPPPNGCELKKYRVPSRIANHIRARLGLQTSPRDFSVCDHMGKVELKLPPRKAKSEPVPSLQPKPKKKR